MVGAEAGVLGHAPAELAVDVHHDVVGAADPLHLLEEAGDGVRAVEQLAIVRRGLVDVGVEQAVAQRHVVELCREVGLDERRHLVEVEQPQVGIVLALVLAPGGPHHLGRLGRAAADLQHVAMRVAYRGVRRAERLERRLLLRERRPLEPGRVDEHQRHVVLGPHRQPLAVGDVDDEVGARAAGSSADAVRPSHPYSLPLLGAAVCQNELEVKCENDGWS